jgi:hypothetical protein
MEFTPEFQREMVVLLLQDPEAYGKYLDIWKPAYFDDVRHRKISEAFIKVRVSAKEHPTKTSVIQELLGDLKDVRNLPMDKEAEL